MTLPRFTMGIGDRFAKEGEAQLAAFVRTKAEGVAVSPVWNKSNREHTFLGTTPDSVRVEADAAVKAHGWKDPYFVDADHISLKTVDKFIQASDFYTIDVADSIGKSAPATALKAFVDRHAPKTGKLTIPGIAQPFAVDRAAVESIAAKYLAAVQEAGELYRHIEKAKGKGKFATEVSMDETDLPQTPLDLWFILCAMADEKVPIQTIAPKFSGRFNKGVDFVGDLKVFEKEFNDDLQVIAYAAKEFGLPGNLKLSVHSGSDKFSLYPIIRRAVTKHGAGLHLKTAGTNWLEEIAGLAAAGGEGLIIAREVYAGAYAQIDAMVAPYASVVDIDRKKLPTPAEVNAWSSQQYVDAVTHDQTNKAFNPSFRQLVHVAFKVAGDMGPRFLGALDAHRAVIAGKVTDNLYRKHLKPLFLDRS